MIGGVGIYFGTIIPSVNSWSGVEHYHLMVDDNVSGITLPVIILDYVATSLWDSGDVGVLYFLTLKR